VLNGKGASLLDGYMEDLATDRIYRLMIAQRIQLAFCHPVNFVNPVFISGVIMGTQDQATALENNVTSS